MILTIPRFQWMKRKISMSPDSRNWSFHTKELAFSVEERKEIKHPNFKVIERAFFSIWNQRLFFTLLMFPDFINSSTTGRLRSKFHYYRRRKIDILGPKQVLLFIMFIKVMIRFCNTSGVMIQNTGLSMMFVPQLWLVQFYILRKWWIRGVVIREYRGLNSKRAPTTKYTF